MPLGSVTRVRPTLSTSQPASLIKQGLAQCTTRTWAEKLSATHDDVVDVPVQSAKPIVANPLPKSGLGFQLSARRKENASCRRTDSRHGDSRDGRRHNRWRCQRPQCPTKSQVTSWRTIPTPYATRTTLRLENAPSPRLRRSSMRVMGSLKHDETTCTT